MSLISEARDLLALYRHNEDLINVGAYVKNSNPRIDLAIEKYPGVENFLKQRYDDLQTREDAFRKLSEIFS
jgi:flagellar biosynthesis/type III secretory pathway ATPase